MTYRKSGMIIAFGMSIYSAIPLVAVIAYLLLLTSLFAHRPWPRRQAYFAAFLIAGIFWGLSDALFRGDFFMGYKLLLARMTLCGFVLTLVPLSHFIETFHNGCFKAHWLALGYCSLVATVVSAALGYLPDRVSYGPVAYAHSDPVLLLAVIGLPFGVIGVRHIYYLLQRLKMAENPAKHNQVIYLVVSIGILSAASLSNVTDLGSEFPIAHSGNLVIAGIFAYAILKGHLVDFKLVARKGLVYSTLTLVVAAIYLALLYSVHWSFSYDLSLPTAVIATAIAIGMAALSWPIRNVFIAKVDELLYPRTHAYRRMVLDFTVKASNVIKIEELRSEITKLAAGAVGVGKAYLLIPEISGPDYAAPFVGENNGYGVTSQLKVKRESPIVERLLRQGKPLFRETLDIMPEMSNLWAEEIETINRAEIEVFAPLINRGNLVGILALTRKEPAAAFDLSDIDLISVLTRGIAIAIENAQLHARIERLAITDMMTGVFNRRYFDERLSEEISRDTRYGGTFSLVIFDLDRFKNYNDTYGHRVGDELLQQVAQAAKESVRSADLVFRYGGDEFALLLPETSPKDAGIVCERLCARLATRMQVEGTGLTLSLGVASWPDDGKTMSEIVRASDEALYYSKRYGGNRVSLFSDMHPPATGTGPTGPDDENPALSAARALVTAVDAKDHYTAPHYRLVAAYATALARAAAVSPEKVGLVEMAALLHDIGKIGVPDVLLSKADKLTPEEWEILKTHSQVAASIIGPVPELAPCLPIVLHNHEWFNGLGYPGGLKGKDIPFEARILAIADAFASMVSARPYRQALTFDSAVEELKKCSGSQFDPDLVALFIPIAHSMSQSAH